MPEPFLLFQFDSAGSEAPAMAFERPTRVIVATSPGEVGPALAAIQSAVDSGYWAAGYVGYEAASAFDNAMTTPTANSLSLLWFGLYEGPCTPPDHLDGAFQISEWASNTDKDHYLERVGEIREAIAAGDAYQVNYTMRLRARFSGDDFALYRRLHVAQQAAYSCYMNLGQYRILSVSPELFFRRDGDTLTTRPMKGTIARGRWAVEDRHQATRLLNSAKDRAENIMIVDLLRNDLGRIAEIGSVAVRRLFEIETYPTLLQMTSTVTATIPSPTTLLDIFTALFPCGSVTGAPKISAMKMIAKLEAEPRQIYCGAIGYVSPHREAVFSVAIRTMLIDNETGNAEYGIGSAITWDSSPNGEYDECLLKAEVLSTPAADFELLETMRLEDGEYRLLDRHLARLYASADYFRIPLDRERVRAEIASPPSGTWRIRLLVSQNGAVRLETYPLHPLPAAPRFVGFATAPVSRTDRFLFHKTTHRALYSSRRLPDLYDTLLWNAEGEVTEFTTGNVVVEIDGARFTPPLDCGLLPGTFREEILDRGEIAERILLPSDIRRAGSIWHINSVRGWVTVTLCDSGSAP